MEYHTHAKFAFSALFTGVRLCCRYGGVLVQLHMGYLMRLILASSTVWQWEGSECAYAVLILLLTLERQVLDRKLEI